MNKNKEMLEIIEGFQSLTSKIKEDNESIKNSLKNKDLRINACKKEYRKLYAEHEELKQKYVELESKIKQNKVEKVKRKRNNNNNNNNDNNNNNNKKKIIIYDDDNDDYDSDNEKSTSEEEEEEEENNYEIVKVKKNKKNKQKTKKNKSKQKKTSERNN